MAAVSVFVDDAIQGTLPLVCAKTGEPANLTVRHRQTVGGGIPPVVLLLLLLGPFSILGLLLVALFWPPGEQLTVRLPETEASYDRDRLIQRLRLGALAGGIVFPVLAFANLGMFPLLWLVGTLASFLVAAGLHVALWRRSIGVSIDVTRRRVTLTNVHPRFVAAVQLQEFTTRR